MTKEETLVKISLGKSGFEREAILENYAKQEAIGFAEFVQDVQWNKNSMEHPQYFEDAPPNSGFHKQLKPLDNLYQQYQQQKT